MKIKWLGHATFMITVDNGIKIICDPYVTGKALKYGDIEETADIVTVSHKHGDHSNVAAVKGNPEVIDQAVKQPIKGIEFDGIPSYHDDAGGSSRGNNIIFCFTVDGIRVCHLGDLGHRLSDEQVTRLGRIDVLLVPVGGYFTMDIEVTSEVCRQLSPSVIIPMHYKNEKCGPEFPIAPVDDFLKGKEGVFRLETSEVEFNQEELPDTTQIMVLQPAM